MQINKKTMAAIAAALILGFVASAIYYGRTEPAPAATSAAPSLASSAAPSAGSGVLVRPHSPRLGPDQARVTVVEFFDPECEACRAMYPIVKQVMGEFEGRAALVIRYMPLHRNSVYAATLLEASRAQNKYWEFLEEMMARQPEWASHAAPRPELLMDYAARIGLDVVRLRSDANDPQIRARLQQDYNDGMSLGANRTPTFFINGAILPRLGAAELRGAVQAQLQNAGK